MISGNSMEQLFAMLTESDKEVIPRIIMLNSSDKVWKETITKAIDKDRILFKSDSYVITYRRYLSDGYEVKEFKGCLDVALNNILACVKESDNMVITVKNLSYNYIKGRRAQANIKLVYIVLQS